MKEYKALVRKVLNDNNILDPQIAIDFENLAVDYVRNTKTFYSEAELNSALTTLTQPVATTTQQLGPLPPIAQQTLQPIPPIQAPPQFGRPRPTRPVTDPTQSITGLPPLQQQPSGDYKNFVRERARSAGLNIIAREEVVREALDFIKDNGRQANSEEIDTMIEANKLLGPRPPPVTLAPPAELQEIDDLISRANTIKGSLTNRNTIAIIDERVGALIDARDTANKTTSQKSALSAVLNIADEPTVVINQSDYKKIPDGIMAEFLRLRAIYINSKNKLERTVFYKKKQSFIDFLNENNIPYIETKVRSKIDAIEGLIGQPPSF